MHLSLFGHIAQMDDNIDAKKILFVLRPEGWKRRRGRPGITCLKTVQNNVKSHNLTLTEALDITQNRQPWLLATFSAMDSSDACQTMTMRIFGAYRSLG